MYLKVSGCFCVLLLALISTSVAGENRPIKDDLEFIIKHQSAILQDLPQPLVQNDFNVSEIGLMTNGLIKLYRALISSQDISACNFSPSCSHFASTAINSCGFFRGTLLSADRLMRCFQFSSAQVDCTYHDQNNKQSYKIYDPVKYYLNLK